jgi:hypothetical protein
MGADGALFAIRRRLHRPVPPHLIDDMYLSLGILCDGYRVVRAGDALAYEESVTSSVEEFRRKIRIACQALNVHHRIWPRLRRLSGPVVYMYVSHKLLRWVAVYNLALALTCSAAGLLAAGIDWPFVAAPAVAAALALRWGHRRKLWPIAQLAEMLIGLAGSGIGVWRSLRGEQFQTWTPAASIRH